MAEESKNAIVENRAKKQKPKKDKRESRIGRKFKEVASELKKVTWPTFPVVVKSIGVVLAVCAVFLVILLGFDLILTYFVHNPLTTGTVDGSGTESLTSIVGGIGGFLNAFRGMI